MPVPIANCARLNANVSCAALSARGPPPAFTFRRMLRRAILLPRPAQFSRSAPPRLRLAQFSIRLAECRARKEGKWKNFPNLLGDLFARPKRNFVNEPPVCRRVGGSNFSMNRGGMFRGRRARDACPFLAMFAELGVACKCARLNSEKKDGSKSGPIVRLLSLDSQRAFLFNAY